MSAFSNSFCTFIDQTTQLWVRLTGSKVDLAKNPWLDGPIAPPSGVRNDYTSSLAKSLRLEVAGDKPGAGLLPAFEVLSSPELDVSRVAEAVKHFYEHTSEYDIDAWSEWNSFARPFGKLLAILFSRRLQQLNIPLSGLDTSRGMSSEIIQLIEPNSGRVRHTFWVRHLLASRNVLFAGCYSTTKAPLYPSQCVKVVFPLPNGNAIVIMRPGLLPDGSFSLMFDGNKFGGPGFYFTVHKEGRTWARQVSAMKERITVYDAGDGTVHADHSLQLWGLTYLRIHYRMRRKI